MIFKYARILLCGAAAAALVVFTHAAQATSAAAPKKPEIGAISRATGGHFREGLTASFTSDTAGFHAHTINTNERGLLTTKESGAFASDLWAGMDGDDMVDMLDHLTPNDQWPATFSLSKRILLTDAPWPEHDDLKTLRLEKIYAFADPEDAARLYSFWAPETPDPRMLNAGLRALLSSGKPSIACVEYMAGKGNGISVPEPLAPALDTTCPHVMAAESGQPVTMNETVVFENLEGLVKHYPPEITPYVPGLSLAPLKNWDIPDILTTDQRAILARLPGTPSALQMKLAASTSLLEVPPLTVDSPDQAIPDGNAAWATLARLYKDQINNPGADSYARTKALLEQKDDIHPHVMTLFTPTFTHLSPDLIKNPADVRTILRTLLAVDSPRSGVFLAALRADLPTPFTHDPEAASLLLLGQIRGFAQANGPLPLSFKSLKEAKETRLAKIFINMSDLLDKRPDFIDTLPEAYEKRMGLTKGNHYVMPLSVLRNHLLQAKENGRTGQVILASLLLLQNQEPTEINPDVLMDILKGMIVAGMGEEARQIATTVLLGITNSGEKQNGTSRSSGTTETKSASVN